MSTPEELDTQIQNLSQRDLDLGATEDEVNSILGRTGLPPVTPAPTVEPNVSTGFVTDTQGFSSDTPQGFVDDSPLGFVDDRIQTKEKVVAEKSVEKAERLSKKSTPTVSDVELSTLVGKTKNLGVALQTGALQSGATFLAQAPRLVKHQALKGVDSKDFDLYASAQVKNARRQELDKALDQVIKLPESPERDARVTALTDELQAQRLTDQEDAIFREQIVPAPKRLPNAKPSKTRSKAARIESAETATKWIATLNEVVQRTRDNINTRYSDPAAKKLENQIERSGANWGEGNYFESVGDFAKGVYNLATEDTHAALQVFTESLPYMISMMVAGSVTLPAEAIRLNDESTDAFVKEFGELPTDSEKQLIQVLSLTGAATDRISAGITGSMAKNVKSFLKTSRKLNQRIPKKMIQGLTTVGSPIAAVVIEGSTEGVQNVLQQTASTIRDVDIDGKEALVDAAHGAIGGGIFSGPSVIKDAVSTTAKGVSSGLDKTSSKIDSKIKKVKGAISQKTDEILEGNDATPTEKIERILTEGTASLDKPARVKRLKKFQSLIQELPTETPEQTAFVEEKAKELVELVRAVKEQNQKEDEGYSTAEAVKTISDEKVDAAPEEIREANTRFKNIVTKMKESSSITLDAAKRVFGSSAFKRATPEEKAVVENYIKTMSEVSKDISEGKDDKFRGLTTHLEDLDTAVSLEDSSGAKGTIDALNNFEQKQRNKIKAYQAALKTAVTEKRKVKFEYDGDTKFAEEGKTGGFINIMKKELKSIIAAKSKAEAIYDTAFNQAGVETESVTKNVEPDAQTGNTSVSGQKETTESTQTVTQEVTKEVSSTAKVKKEIQPTKVADNFVGPLAETQRKLQKQTVVLGDGNNQLPTLKLEKARKDILRRIGLIKNAEQVKRVQLAIKQLKASLLVAAEDVSGIKGNHEKSLGENLLTNTTERKDGNANVLVQTDAKDLKNKVGTPAGFTVSDVFVASGKEAKGLFNTVHNFFSRYKEKGFNKFLEERVGTLTKDEHKILSTLADYSENFAEITEAITSFTNGTNLFPENKTALSSLDQNPLGYLVKTDNKGTPYLNENLMSLMATVSFNWLGTRARKTLHNTDSDINAILGRSEDTLVTEFESNTFRTIGTTQTALAEALGREVVKQLGLKVTNKVDGNMLARLELSVGLTMLGVLKEQGHIEQTSVSSEVMNAVRNVGDENAAIFDIEASTQFIKLTPSKESLYRAPAIINSYADSLDSSKDFLERLFGIVSHEKYVSTKPVTTTPKVLKRTIQLIPKKVKAAILETQKVEWEVKDTIGNLVRNISAETLYTLAGVQEVDGSNIHTQRRANVEAKNAAIVRELENYIKSADELNGRGFFLEWEAIKNMRLMVVGNMLNPQASKLHRHLVGAKEWNTTVAVSGTPEADSQRKYFKLAVAQAFGYSIDKNNLETSLAAFEDIRTDPVILKGVAALKGLEASNVSPSEQKALETDLKAAVVGKENFHTLDGLIALAAYKENAPFDTNITLEADGVTNGVMLGMMQSALEPDMKNILASGGVYLDGTKGDNFPDWISKPENQDLYQKLAGSWSKALTDLKLKSGDGNLTKKINAIESIVGVLVQEGTVTSIGRNLAKDPLMFTNYGAGINGVIRELSGKILTEAYSRLEEASQAEDVKAATREVMESVYVAANLEIPAGIDYSAPLEIDLLSLEDAIGKTIKATYGKALETALNEQFSQFFRFRENINTALNLMFQVFNKQYKEDIKVAEKDKGKKLTPEEKTEIFKRNRAYLPTFNGPTSTSIEDSLLVIKDTKVRNYKEKSDRVQVTFKGSPFEANSVSGVIGNREYAEGGVSGLVLGTQSQDISTQIQTMMEYPMLNVHDALIIGVDQIGDATKRNNEAFLDVAKNYSMMDEVYTSFLRVMRLVRTDREMMEELNTYLNNKDEAITLQSYLSEMRSLQKEVSTARKKILTEENTQVGQFGLDSESVFIANETVSDVGIETLITEAVDSALKGSSVDPVDFDTFTSQYDELLTAENSLRIFEDMEGYGNKTETVSHKAHLKSVLTQLVNKALNPMDSLLFRVGETTETTHGAIKGERIHVNASVGMRLNNSEMSVQEVQVHELVHAISSTIDSNFKVRKEAVVLFKQVSQALTEKYGEGNEWKVFMPDTVLHNVVDETAAAKDRYNYIFNNKKTTHTQSFDEHTGLISEKITNDYLHEFIAFGLTNEKFGRELSTIQFRRKEQIRGKTFTEKLFAIYQNLLNWLSGKLYNTRDISADKALFNLVGSLNDITTKQRQRALQKTSLNRALDDKLTKAIQKYILQPFIDWRENPNRTTTTRTGEVLDTVATLLDSEGNKQFRKAFKAVLSRMGIAEDMFLVKLVREFQGTKDNNIRWHTLLRYSKHLIDSTRKHVADEIIKEVRKQFTEPLSKEESVAFTKAFMKTDLSVLLADSLSATGEVTSGKYTQEEIVELLKDSTKLIAAIQATKTELNGFSEQAFYQNQARGLGNIMSLSKDGVDNQLLNAYNIANLITTGREPTGDVVKAEEIIERLSTLYALNKTTPDSRELLAQVMEREYAASTTENGITYMANTQRYFKEEALDKLFDGNKTQMAKGYVAERFNPNVDIKIAPLSEEAQLALAGYVRRETPIKKDRSDPNRESIYMYVSKNNVGHTYLKAIASLTSRGVKGSTLLDGYQSINSGTPTQDSAEALIQVKGEKALLVNNQFRNAVVPTESNLIPILDEKGVISGYRYLMSESDKVNLLERDDRYDRVLGSMFGSIKDKVNSKDVNRRFIELAYEDYQEGFAENPSAYTRIAVNAPEGRYQELYNMLPEEARRDMQEVWGKKEIYVRKELVDLIFGYRKWSLGDTFKNKDLSENENDPTAVQLSKAGMRRINDVIQSSFVRHSEAVWQEVVSLAKTNIVIRNPAVLIGNFISNLALSWVKGVPPVYMIRNQALAIEALKDYQNQLSEKDILERLLLTDLKMSATKRSNTQNKINQLNDSLTANPVKDLIDEGIFQSIVEDLPDTENPFNYKDRVLAKTGVTRLLKSKKAKPAVAVGEQLYLSEDTSAFKMMLKATQYSDFIARFAMHKYNTEVLNKSKEESIRDVVETFINYDIPTSRALQYMNDMGFLMFSKFLFRIQKVILNILKERPASVLSTLILQNVFGEFSDIVDSNLITGSLMGRMGFFLGPLDSATELAGLNIGMDVVGY